VRKLLISPFCDARRGTPFCGSTCCFDPVLVCKELRSNNNHNDYGLRDAPIVGWFFKCTVFEPISFRATQTSSIAVNKDGDGRPKS
jgi:hypothetical protein